jgi:predicted O-methyltransferase YrrM
MNEFEPKRPAGLDDIERATKEVGFNMASDHLTGSLAASKPGGRLLELGTGTGVSASWLLDGMDAAAKLTSVDSSEENSAIAKRFLGRDPRLTLIVADGAEVLGALQGQLFDLVFADTWPGKYRQLDLALNLVTKGGYFLVDDMLPQLNWPPGHGPKAEDLIDQLENRPDLHLTKLAWSSGLIIAVKR